MREQIAAPRSSAKSRLVVRLGECIHLIRRALKLSQTQLAERLGRVKNTPISRLERGEARMIDLDLLDRLIQLAEGAGYSAQWLLRAEHERVAFTEIDANGLPAVAGSLQSGGKLKVGRVELEYRGGGCVTMHLGTTRVEFSLAGDQRLPWVSRTIDGPHPLKVDAPRDEPLMVLGPGGDYRQPLYPSDLTGKPQESDNVTGATAGPGA